MMDLNDKLKGLISEKPSEWKDDATNRISTQGWRKNSRAVALRVLRILRERKMSQSALAELMGVSRQQVSKIVKGQENFTFETMYKLESALEVTLMKIEKGYSNDASIMIKLGTLTSEIYSISDIQEEILRNITTHSKQFYAQKLFYQYNADEYKTYEIKDYYEESLS